MAIIQEVRDITGYYDAALNPRQAGDVFRIGDIDLDPAPFHRWPVRNREERTPVDSRKRAIIHERDGNICRLCGTGGHLLTIDHIIPRSAFPPHQLVIADRSDNLISACWPCNEGKSNYEHPQIKRMGVVVRCWDCSHPDYDAEEYQYDTAWEDPRPECTVLAYCGQCGITTVPSIAGWIL